MERNIEKIDLFNKDFFFFFQYFLFNMKFQIKKYLKRWQTKKSIYTVNLSNRLIKRTTQNNSII